VAIKIELLNLPPVTCAELIGVLPIAAEFRSSAGMQPNLVAKEQSKTFSDIENYWAASILTQMSSYCSVAAAITDDIELTCPLHNYLICCLILICYTIVKNGQDARSTIKSSFVERARCPFLNK
jgi:hypothetical protein